MCARPLPKQLQQHRKQRLKLRNFKPMLNSKTKNILFILIWTLIFTLAYAQSPLFTSNQNQYFLHGLAKANFGILSEDWLANTLDSTPVFSFFVQINYWVFHNLNIFYVYYAIMLGVYLFALTSILTTLFNIKDNTHKNILLLVITLIHSSATRFLLSHLINSEWTFTLEGGVAGQRILGQVLQPSTAGVFLILSIALFLKNKSIPAAIWLAIATTIHPTYLFSAGIITIAYLWIQWRESNSLKAPFKTGLTALLLVLPILAYSFYIFLSGDIATNIDPQAVLVDLRIPHHTKPAEWFNLSVVVQLIILVLALIISRKKRIFPILFITFITASILTILVQITGNTTLALMFPWRVTAILMPISTAIITTFILDHIWHFHIQKWTQDHPKGTLITLSSLAIIFVAIGITRFTIEANQKYNSAEREMENWVKENHQSGDLYLVPIKMQDFRLATGVPILADFKSIPYYEADVLEWRTRMLNASNFYKSALIEPDGCYLSRHLQAGYTITHIVLPIELEDYLGSCWSQEPIYQNDGFYILKIW